MDEKRHTALITGASSGIGREYARQLAAKNYDLILVSNEKEKIAETGQTLSQEYRVRTYALYRDLSSPNAAKNLYDFCSERQIEIHILVNNAGIFFFNDLTGVTEERLIAMLNLHLHTITLLCYYFGRQMKRRGQGYILNMSSISAWMPLPGISVYAASKAYILRLSRSLHHELRDYGITVTAVCPGAVATGLYPLGDRYKKIALRTHIMSTPEQVVQKALKGMFARKSRIIPGYTDRFLIVCTSMIPAGLIRLIKRKAPFYRYENQ